MPGGETVRYTYDSLNRLASAETVSSAWGEAYAREGGTPDASECDGFGNLTTKSVTKGSAQTLSVSYSASTNRRTSDCADANGNLDSGFGCGSVNTFDIENRLIANNGGGTYSYAPDNKRVYKKVSSTEEITFWNGKKLATYQLSVVSGTLRATSPEHFLYFGGKLIKNGSGFLYTDLRGSTVRTRPFGEESSATSNNKTKFATYYRDSESGLDYAMNRYHSPGDGRFLSPDPSTLDRNPVNPGTWNMYSYVGGDPINRTDPTGLYRVPVPPGWEAVYCSDAPDDPDCYPPSVQCSIFGICLLSGGGPSGPTAPDAALHALQALADAGIISHYSVQWDIAGNVILTGGFTRQFMEQTWPGGWPIEIDLPHWVITVEDLLAALRKGGLLVIVALFERELNKGEGLRPDPDKCPKGGDFGDKTKPPHEGWKWQEPIGNQDGYWWNGTSRGIRLHPHLDWEGAKPPHWDYTDPLGGQWECDKDGNIHRKGGKWWE